VVKIYVIIVYDVVVGRVNEVKKFLRQHLNWVQNSAFEGELTRGELEMVKMGLKELIREDEDSVLFYVASSPKWVKKGFWHRES